MSVEQNNLKCFRCGEWDGERCGCKDGQTIFHGDCLEIIATLPYVNVVIVDPPYGTTSLEWDKRNLEWVDGINADCLWCFGPMRLFLEAGASFQDWKYAQDIVWEKHNGSCFHADRFRRIHEHAVQFYNGPWSDVYKKPITTNDATRRTVRTKARPPHTGDIARIPYVSEDGGPRLQRSVLKVRSCHGYAQHPTQKPVGIVRPLVEYSCPPAGEVLDPFVGSGTTLVACKELGRRGIGIEIEEKYCEIAANRLRQNVLDFG